MKTSLIIQLLIALLITTQIKSQEKPALNIKLNPPEEDPKDTIDAINDIDKLENDLRIGSDEDFAEEKKKIIEIQKTKIHDIVHGAFVSLNALIPNPIKSTIRKAIRDKINGKSLDATAFDTKASQSAVDSNKTTEEIAGLQKDLSKSSAARFMALNSENISDDLALNVNQNLSNVDYNDSENNYSNRFLQNDSIMKPM